jgi:Cu2+-exporting ATPase
MSKDDSREERHSATVQPGHTAHGALHDHAEPTNAPPTHVHHVAGAGHTGHGAHDKHAGHSVAMFRDKFWISLLLTLPTLAASPNRLKSKKASA